MPADVGFGLDLSARHRVSTKRRAPGMGLCIRYQHHCCCWDDCRKLPGSAYLRSAQESARASG
jgi:hypothetical protein